MTSKSLTGTYFGGYTIAAGVTSLLIEPTAKIEGVGLIAPTAVTVTNQGTVLAGYGLDGTTGAGGVGHTAATFHAVSQVTNSGLLDAGFGGSGGAYAGGTGGSAPAGGAGGNGVVFLAASTMTNTGTILAGGGGHGGTFYGYGGLGGIGGAGGIGVDLAAGGLLTNSGHVSGGEGGDGGDRFASAYGTENGPAGKGGVGVVFGASGSLSNRGVIEGGHGARFSTSVQGGDGVAATGSSAKLTIGNTGTIIGGVSATFGGEGVRAANATIVNSGLIAGGGASLATSLDIGGDGILLGVGTVTNAGTVTGGAGGGGALFQNGWAGGVGLILRQVGVVNNNAGVIEGGAGGGGADAFGDSYGARGGVGGIGVDLLAGGNLTNRATIIGGAGGNGGAVDQYNKPGQGGAGGVGVVAAAVTTIINLGQIEGGVAGALGAGFQGAPGQPAPDGDGLRLTGGSLTNGSATAHTAVIQGNRGVVITGTVAATVTNFATIAAAHSYGYSVVFNSTKDVLIAGGGATFVGSAAGDGGAFVLGAGSSGTIATMGHYASITVGVSAMLQDFRSYTIAAGANWAMQQGSFNKSTLGALAETLAVQGGLTVTGGFSLGASGTVLATGAGDVTLNLASGTVTNAGLIETQGAAQVVCDSDLDNSGKLFAVGGTINLQGFVSGGGVIDIQGGTVIVAQPLDETVAFTGATPKGRLVLTQSQFFGGTISGFSKTGTTSLDLQDILFSAHPTASYSGTVVGGVLTVTTGDVTAQINLKGNYLASTWTLSSDGSGGTLVVDPTPASPHIAPLAQAMAGFAAAGTGHELWPGHGSGPPTGATMLLHAA